MPVWERFREAPITEALLDIRAVLAPSVDLSNLSSLHDGIGDQYPQKRERTKWEGAFKLSSEGPEVVRQSGGPDGFLFSSQDGHQIVQVRLDGFTLNRLRPYDAWEPFRTEAKAQWERYREVTSPSVVTRIALRYINRIEIPLPMKDFREYVLTVPEVAPNLPQGLSEFFMRLVIPDPGIGCMGIIIETMEPPTERILPLILDIDVYREALLEPASAEMWELFEQLREFKNRIFFGSITDKAKELFK